METLLNRGKLMTGRDQERLSERDLVMIAKFWGGPVTVNKRILCRLQNILYLPLFGIFVLNTRNRQVVPSELLETTL